MPQHTRLTDWVNPVPIILSRDAYEQTICEMLQAPSLPELKYESVENLQREERPDGYTFGLIASSYDGLPRYLILCDHSGRTASADAIHNLRHRVELAGSDRGIIVSTAGFESEAITTAERYGISLILVAEEDCGEDHPNPKYVGWHCLVGHSSLLCKEYPEHLAECLGARMKFYPERGTAVFALNNCCMLRPYSITSKRDQSTIGKDR